MTINEDYLYNLDLAGQVNLVYSKFVELTDGEEDPCSREYNEWCCDVLQRAVQYIYIHEKERKKG